MEIILLILFIITIPLVMLLMTWLYPIARKLEILNIKDEEFLKLTSIADLQKLINNKTLELLKYQDKQMLDLMHHKVARIEADKEFDLTIEDIQNTEKIFNSDEKEDK